MSMAEASEDLHTSTMSLEVRLSYSRPVSSNFIHKGMVSFTLDEFVRRGGPRRVGNASNTE